MNVSEFYTAQFYSWEYRGRGWLLYDEPVQLEPPFIPYFRTGYRGAQIDDGKRHTWASALSGFFKKEIPKPIVTQQRLDYETVEAFPYACPTEQAAVQLKLAKDRRIHPEQMKACLLMLSVIDSIVSFEIIGTDKEIIVQFVSDKRNIPIITTYLNAFFPQCSTVPSEWFLEHPLKPDTALMVVDYGLQHEWMRPMQTSKSFSLDPLLGIIAILERLPNNAQAGMQILFQPTCNQWHESMIRSVSSHDGSSFFMNAPEAPQLAQEKARSPLYAVTLRTFAQDNTVEDAAIILSQLSHALVLASKSAGNQLIPLVHEAYDIDTRLQDIFLRESHRLGMLVSLDELVTLLHIPSESIPSKKLYAGSRKTKEVSDIAKEKAYILGENNHHGICSPVSISVEDRLKHTHIIGATGTGKSTLIANLILQDIANNHSVILFDPHGDLVDSIMARVPEERIPDVVLIDPSDIEHPIGINILEAKTDIEKEVLSSDLVASFKKFATSWGDQMHSVLGNAIAAILESSKGGTLHDLRRFLLEKEFRSEYLQSVSDPSLQYYWLKEYPILKTSSVGSIITRLDTFLRPRSIRNMLVQKEGLDFETLCSNHAIILCKLSQGLIGAENSYLLGSLLLSSIHQAMLRRQQQEERHPVFIYLDEFQHFITPSIKDMISGIRKYQVGLILSHQDLQQLQREDGELLNTILGNTYNRIVFRVGEPDAKKLQDGFVSFDAVDLQNLGRGEAIVRIEQPQYDCSLDTLPLQEVSEETTRARKEAISVHSRSRYAKSKQEVEEAFFSSLSIHPDEEIKVRPTKKQDVKKEEAAKPTPPAKEKVFSDEIIRSTEASPLTHADVSATQPKRDTHTHRYLQTLVKKMAEERGYTATIEQALPNGAGIVDVLLQRNNDVIAVEICITTDPVWEVHNIQKCLKAQYPQIVSLCTDAKQLDRIKKKCIELIPDFANHNVSFYTPDTFFVSLDEAPQTPPAPQETVMKGYRVNVTYDTLTPEEAEQKRRSVTKVVMDSLRKRKKNE